jgi:hypothetical protein
LTASRSIQNTLLYIWVPWWCAYQKKSRVRQVPQDQPQTGSRHVMLCLEATRLSKSTMKTWKNCGKRIIACTLRFNHIRGQLSLR